MEVKKERIFSIKSIISALSIPIMTCVIASILIIVHYININKYNGWQPVTVENVGTFYVPKDWVVTQYDGYIYDG